MRRGLRRAVIATSLVGIGLAPLAAAAEEGPVPTDPPATEATTTTTTAAATTPTSTSSEAPSTTAVPTTVAAPTTTAPGTAPPTTPPDTDSAPALLAANTIAGTVTGTDGALLDAVHVQLSSDFSFFETTTGTDGRFEFLDLPDDTYSALFQPAGGQYAPEWWQDAADFGSAAPIVVSGGTAVELDVELQAVAYSVLRGRVTDEGGTPIPDVYVAAEGIDFMSGFTDVNGEYALTVAPGTYTIRFEYWFGGRVTEWWDDAPTFDLATPVSIAAGDSLTLDAVLAARPQGTSALSGTVVEEVSGDPIAGLTVMAWGPDVASTTTDEFGHYSISDLLAGTYTLQFGDEFGPTYAAEWWDNAPSSDLATPIELTDGETRVFDAALAIVPGAGTASIAGTVVDRFGAPIAGTFVNVSGPTPSFALTDENGTYRIGALPAGDYTVEFADTSGRFPVEWWDDASSLAEATTVSVADGADVAGIDAVLTKPSSAAIAGRVTDDDGTALADASVTAIPTGGGAGEMVRTDASGNYAIEVSAGEYWISFQSPIDPALSEYYDDARSLSEATALTVVAGDELAGIDAALDGPGSISGRVTAAGEPVADVMVTARGPRFIDPVWTAADGTYTIPVVQPGSYTLRFEPAGTSLRSEWYDDAEQGGDATAVNVAASGDVTGIDVELDPGGSISGTISGTSGEPLAGAAVEVNNGGRWVATTTDDTGRYTVGGLAGMAIIRVTHAGFVERYWPDASLAAEAGRVVIESGSELTGHDVSLIALGAVSGTVSGPDGRVVSARVDLLPLVDGFGQTVLTDELGNYTFADVRPGTYQVQFNDVSEPGLVGEFWEDAATEEDARAITVPEGGVVTGIDAELTAAGILRGRVTDQAGQPVPYRALTISGRVGDGEVITDGDGRYQSFVRPGTGSVLAAFPDYVRSSHPYTGVEPGLVTELDITVVAGESLSGVVLAPDGADIAMLSVSAYSLNDELIGFADTSLLPDYSFGGLPAGPVELRVSAFVCGRSCATWSTTADVDVAEGQNTFDIELGDFGAISGLVTNEVGAPLAATGVSACSNGDCPGLTDTNDDGTYRLDQLPPGVYDVTVGRQSRTVIVTSGGDTTDIDFVVPAGATISGRVTTSSGAVPGGLVSALSVVTGDREGVAFLDVDGSFTIGELPAGEYVVCVEQDDPFQNRPTPIAVECWDNAASITDAARLSVAAGESISGIDLILGGPSEPRGLAATAGSSSVTLAWDAAVYSGGRPVTDYVVQYATAAGSWATFDDGVSASRSATVTGLQPGTAYRFRVAAVNAFGTGVASAPVIATTSTPSGVPGRPILLAVPRSGAVTLLWSRPRNGGSPITDYVIQHSTNGTTWTTVADGVSTAQRYTVTGLTRGVTYRFRVAAVNVAGTGPFSIVMSARPR